MAVSRRYLMAAGVMVGANFMAGAGWSQAAPLDVALDLALSHPDGRNTSYRAICPARDGSWGVVLFSHGANSSNRDYDRLWRAWASAGFLVIGPDHIDTGPPATQPKIAPAALWRTRLEDTSLPLNQRSAFDRMAQARGASINWSAVGAAGHSFGAVVAQALAGARLIAPGQVDARSSPNPAITACIALSPPGPLKGFIPADAWSTVTTPALLQTGDADILPGFVDDWRLRLTGFAERPDRWTLIGHGVNHYFHGLICRLNPGASADMPALSETANLSSRFLDAYLLKDSRAMNALSVRASVPDDGVAIFSAT